MKAKTAKPVNRKMFEADRRMELRLRLALKRVEDPMPAAAMGSIEALAPDEGLLSRLIERVQKL
jgi:hypothetical protein